MMVAFTVNPVRYLVAPINHADREMSIIGSHFIFLLDVFVE